MRRLLNIKSFCRLLCRVSLLASGMVLFVGLNSFSVQAAYVTPFPSGGTYKILVLGDGFADGAWVGLSSAFKGNPKIEVFKEVSYGARLTARGRQDWLKKLDKILNKRAYDICVVMIGYGDRRKITIRGKSYAVGSPQWRSFYSERIRGVLQKLSARKISTYWVGMPIPRSNRVRRGLELINAIVKQETARLQVRYIDQWFHFANENGQYSPYGPDVNGKIRLLRARDGVFFTRAGYEKLGFFIQKFIQQDLREARAERDIPLLGETSDQEYLLNRYALDNPRERRSRNRQKADPKTDKKLKALAGTSSERQKYETAKHSKITLPAKKSQSGKEIELKIIRPAIPAVAFTISRRNNAFSNDQGAAVLMKEQDEKITGFSIASSLGQITGNNDQRRIPLTQTPYYKLVVRGDAQLAKPGRADYFILPASALKQKTDK